MGQDLFQEGRMTRPSIAHGDALPTGTQPLSLAEGLASGSTIFPSGRFVFLGAAGDGASSTYAEVLARAEHILCGLRREGIKPGDKLILYFRACADFIPTLWAALLAGAIPLPLARNEWNRGHAARAPQVFAHLRKVLDRPRVITDGLEREQQAALGLEALDIVPLAAVEAGSADANFFEGSLDEPRLLILSSGTTATPNLVMLSARALINRWWPTLPDPTHAATFLSWSPFDHVMGLGLVSPNLPTKVHLSTGAFVQSPALWLTALDRFRVTHCTLTNFGMSLVARAAADGLAAGQVWDLSSVRKIGVGAEAISPDVCHRFLAALQPFGLRSDAIILGYGLSECGPVVGGEHPFSATDDPEGSPFALLDKPTRGHSVRIVGEGGRLVAEGDVGAVEVRGPTMTRGYYGDEQGTRALFTADGWIRTGDTGRLDAGRLTITGREKEIIIIHAKKFACTEIETIAQSVAGVETALAVACKAPEAGGRRGPQDRFALFFIPSPAVPVDLETLLRGLRTRIASHFGMPPAHLVPIVEDDIPRTPTGKVRRLELAARLEAGAFDGTLARLRALLKPSTGSLFASESERRIAAIWAEILGVEDCGRDDDFFDMGGDSLSAEVLILAIERAFKRRVPPDLLHHHTTIARLAGFVDCRPPGGGESITRATPVEPAQPEFHPPMDGPPRAGNPPHSTPQQNAQRKRNAATLAWALGVAKSANSALYDKVWATQALVAFGMADEADALIGNVLVALEQEGRPVPKIIGRLVAINAHFRRAGIDLEVKQLGDLGRLLLSSSQEAVLWQSGKSDRLLVVFNTMQGDFWVSNPVLHCILRKNSTNILYLKDPRELLFLGGLRSFGKDFAALLSGVASIAADLAVSDIRVMGFSSAGYAGLLAASRLHAAAYLGFSVPTVLSPRSPVPGRLFAAGEDGAAENLRVDLKPFLRDRAAPRAGVLYYGENNAEDAAQAEHLADLANFIVKEVPGAGHNTVMALLADGEFAGTVRSFLR